MITCASATSGTRAREEVAKILRRFGCEAGRVRDTCCWRLNIAAGKSRENPWTSARRSTRVDYEQTALKQGHIAVNSILRYWIKGQITAIETGILSFEAVFMPYMLTADGRPIIERLRESNLLPPPVEEKVVSLAKGYGQRLRMCGLGARVNN